MDYGHKGENYALRSITGVLIYMYAIEFDANIRDGIIQIPARYKKQFVNPHNVKVILLSQETSKTRTTQPAKTENNGFGVLSRFANPALWEQENGAWERAAVEKHEAR
jgi:hypothetical protein